MGSTARSLPAARPLALAGLLALGLAWPARATVAAQQARTTAPEFRLPRLPVERYRLPNGLTVLLSRDTTVQVVAVQVWYHVGSKDERPGRTGFAHLFEHLAFLGTQHVSGQEIDRILEEAGGSDYNGGTTVDRTNYLVTLPSRELETALWVEAERMGFLLPVLDQAKLEAVRGVVQNERRQRVDNQAYGVADEVVHAALFPASHPYARPVIGSLADLRAATLADVTEFFHRYYAPGNATLAIVGDFDPAHARALVAKYFGPIPAGPTVARPKIGPVTLAAEQRLVLEDPKATMPRLLLAWPSVGRGHPASTALAALAQVLTRDRTSRLTKLLVHDRQLATEVSASHTAYERAGLFQIKISPRPGASLTTIERLVDSALAALAATGPSAAELDRLKRSERVNAVFGLGDAKGKANQLLAGQVFHGDPWQYMKVLERRLRMTPAELARAQRTYLTPGRVVLSMVPQGQAAAAADPARPFTRVAPPPEETPVVAAAAAAPGPVPPRAPRLTPETFARTRPAVGPAKPLPWPAVQRRTLRNGIPVTILEDHGLPMVRVSVVTDIPASADPAGKTGLGTIVHLMLAEGTATRTAEQIADAEAALGISGTVYGFFTITPDMDSALALMADQLRRPAFPEAALQRVKANVAAGLKQRKANAPYLAHDIFARVVYGAEHPYARTATEPEVTAITRADVRQFYDRYYRPPNVQFIVAGDLTADQAVAALERHFGDWPAGAAARRVPPEPTATGAGTIYLYDRPHSRQSVIVLGGLGPRRDVPEYYALDLAYRAFGGTYASRLNVTLREVHHYTYGVRSGFEFRRPPEVSTFTARMEVETAKTDSALAVALQEFNDLRGPRPLTAAEVTFARDAVLNELPIRLETLGGRAVAVSGLVSDALPFDHYATLAPNYQRVTPAAAAAAAAQYLDPARLAIVVVGDRQAIEAKLRALNLAPVVVVSEEDVR